jgi:hypothetical protein
MLQLPQAGASRRAVKSTTAADPIFSLIETHKRLQAASGELTDQLEEAEFAAGKTLGRRPFPLVEWREYTVCEYGIEERRENLLAEGHIAADLIEQEFLDAKARYAAIVAAGREWDKRAGLTSMSRKVKGAMAAEKRFAARFAKTKPTTAAGAGALLQYILSDELCDDAGYWHGIAIRTVADALVDMNDGRSHD